ncbi:MAG: hypothetical protein HQ559_09950, partial [Lentisphaerae bacterium]|nr:hypothetical protein [Lentisphaerota bacterium]
NLDMADYPLDVSCNRGFGIHDYFKWGWPCVSVENWCLSTWNSHLLIAYARGGARQYGARWGCDFSPCQGVAGAFETMYHRDGRWLSGISASHNLRGWMLGFLSGADYVEAEVTDRTHFVIDHDPVPKKEPWGGSVNARTVQSEEDLSPAGRAGVAFGQYALTRHPERGEPFTPLAVIVRSGNGWNAVGGAYPPDVPAPSKDPYIEPYRVWFGKIDSTPADWMMSAFYRTAFSAEPIFGWQDGSWPATANTTDDDTAIKEERHRLLMEGKVRVEDVEAGRYMGTSRWGDTIDVLTEDVPLESLRQYPMALLLGGMPDDDHLWDRLEEYVRQGGLLIVNVAQVPRQRQAFYGAAWHLTGGVPLPEIDTFETTDAAAWTPPTAGPQDVYAVKRDKGTAYLTGTPWAVTSPRDLDRDMTALIDELYKEISPVRLIGPPVHYLVNRLPNEGWLVAVFNHFKEAWRGEVLVRGCTAAFEQWEDRPLEPADDDRLMAEVPPYAFRIYRFEPVRCHNDSSVQQVRE